MSKRVKTAIILVATALLIVLGVYLFFQPVHVPVWMTYPYDVTIQTGGAKINYYLSEEKEVNIPDRIWGAEVRYIAEDAFSILGTDAIILEVPNRLDIEELYHYESHSYYKVFDESVWMTKYVGNERKVEIPEEVWGRKVTYIARNCFLNMDVEEVVIPDTVTHIGGGAFKGCRNLKQINFPACLEYIGAESFEEAGLEKVEFSENIAEISSGAFAYSEIKEITGIKNVENIGNGAFRGTPWEESIEGDFVCIEDMLYLYRGDSDEVIIPSTVREIRGAFQRQENYPYPKEVNRVFIPYSVKYISAYSFANQENIEVYIPETVAIIGDSFEDPGAIFTYNHGNSCGTIVTTENSYAQIYAMDLGIPYRIISKEEMQQNIESAEHVQEDDS